MQDWIARLVVIAFVMLTYAKATSAAAPALQSERPNGRTSLFQAGTKKVSAASMRDLFNASGNRVSSYLAAAEDLQALGKDKAYAILCEFAELDKNNDSPKTIILCRMLFQPRPNERFRRPLLGMPFFVAGSSASASDEKEWPLQPIEIVDGVPFRVVRGYISAGPPINPAAEYLEYCMKKCEWSGFKYKRKTESEIRTALEKFLSSSKMKGCDQSFYERQIRYVPYNRE